MPRAIWNGKVLAESNNCIEVDGYTYFPVEDVRSEHLRPSELHTVCGWKGTASYYDIVVDGETNSDAAWYYPEPKPEAKDVAGRIGFWRGIVIER